MLSQCYIYSETISCSSLQPHGSVLPAAVGSTHYSVVYQYNEPSAYYKSKRGSTNLYSFGI